MPGLKHPYGRLSPGTSGDGGALRLLLAGHSLSFAAPIAQLARRAGAEVREDVWQRHASHDEEASAAGLAWADVVHCEWCLGNAVWFSRNKRPGQRLVVRFHRMEVETPHPGEVDLDRVDALVFVARHVLLQACERFGWDADDPRFHVLPNGVDADGLRAAKLPSARYTLAMIGYVPRLKRPELALDILDLLRARDGRYRLLIKGRPPWEYGWMVDRDEERCYFEKLYRRVERSPNLRRAVSFEPFGEDIPRFLRQAGWIVSTSEVEGHSVALAEGMASGAIPVILERPGADEQYEARWVHADAAAAAQAIFDVQEHVETPQRRDFATEGLAAGEFAERWSWERLAPIWERLLLRESAAAEPLAKVA